MIIATVVGRVWGDRRHDALEGVRFLSCRTVPGDEVLVAADLVQASPGDKVLVATDEAAMALARGVPIDAAIVAIVGDTMDPLD